LNNPLPHLLKPSLWEALVAAFTGALVVVAIQQCRLEMANEAPVFDFQPAWAPLDNTLVLDLTNKGTTAARETQVTASASRQGFDGKLLEGPYNLALGKSERLVPPGGHLPTRLFSLKTAPTDREVIKVEARIDYRNGLGERESQSWCEVLIPKNLGGGAKGRWIDCADLPVVNVATTISTSAGFSAQVRVAPPSPAPTPQTQRH
jgi:hypothetical protein